MVRITMMALMMILAPSVSQADLRATSDRPSFSSSELVIIERNAALSAVVGEDPWLVRRLLDALEAERATGETPAKVNPDRSTSNPDLDGMGRSSAEAAHDLLQLLKQAGSGGVRK